MHTHEHEQKNQLANRGSQRNWSPLPRRRVKLLGINYACPELKYKLLG